MRTFPRSLATFRKIVDERGAELRRYPFEDLKQHAAQPTETLVVESRPATISIIVQDAADGGIRVVVQGFMSGKLLPCIKNVALDGFYKYPDERVVAMPDEEFYKFD